MYTVIRVEGLYEGDKDAAIAYMNAKSGFFLAERKKLQALNSRLLLSAVDFVEASGWLIAGDRLAQALVMLDNAIEVALQGELDRIHRILIANTKELNDFRTLKSLLRDAFLKHPSGGCVDIPPGGSRHDHGKRRDRLGAVYGAMEKSAC